MTKIVDLFKQQENQEKKNKPIEFKYALTRYAELTANTCEPNELDYVALYQRHEGDGEYDKILGWNEDKSIIGIFLGHWNDGVVE